MIRSKLSPSQSSSSSNVVGLWPEISWPSSAITATANGSSSPFLAPADLTYIAWGNIRCSRLSAIGERTLFKPHANSTACGLRVRGIAAVIRMLLYGAWPASIYPGHALTLPVQHGDQREQPARGLEIDPHLALQSLLQRARSLV